MTYTLITRLSHIGKGLFPITSQYHKVTCTHYTCNDKFLEILCLHIKSNLQDTTATVFLCFSYNKNNANLNIKMQSLSSTANDIEGETYKKR